MALKTVFLTTGLALQALRSQGQQGGDVDETRWLRNNGISIGWNFLQPKWEAFDGLIDHFNSETGFTHSRMDVETPANGISLGFAFFGKHGMGDFEYRSQGQRTAVATLQKTPTDATKELQLKLYFHSVRFSYNYGFTVGRYQSIGLYVGSAVYAGTWDLKYRDGGSGSWTRQTSDDFSGFSMGVSPQVVLHLRYLELKGYYDVPFFQTDLRPAYDDVFKSYTATTSGSDSRLKSGLSGLGVCATLVIPVFKSRADERYDTQHPKQTEAAPQRTMDDVMGDFKNRMDQQQKGQDQKNKIDEIYRQRERDEQKSNDRQHERDRRGY